MRININLASNPYEAAREYTRRLGMLVGVLAVLTVGLLGYILYQRSHTRDIDQKIAAAKQELASLDAEKAHAQATLNQPQNRDVADQSQFLNQLFARKALSWTRVFAEMEKLMPPNIHVVSMKPEFNRENQLVLRVVVATPARDKAVELVKRMEKSPHFRTPQVEAENTLGEGGTAGGNIQFEIAAVYIPFADDTDSDSGADHAKDKKAIAPEKKTPPKPLGASSAPTAQKAAASTGGAR
jgi:type IV pilus assembly protein PilN